jgi:hypothetical protein
MHKIISWGRGRGRRGARALIVPLSGSAYASDSTVHKHIVYTLEIMLTISPNFLATTGIVNTRP